MSNEVEPRNNANIEKEVGLKTVKKWLHRCGRCNSCKYIYKNYRPSCPSGQKFTRETYWSSGRNWMARALEDGSLKWTKEIV